ncbi:MAG: hypothetical protein J6K50_01450, partial [Clostridia bacterium]|nr:hypothetical protein [Clostridia bacterium]
MKGSQWRRSTWKKLLCAGILSCTMIGGAATFASCDEEANNGDDPFQTAYSLYVTYAEASGETPATYEDWLATIKGEKGDKSDKGDKGDKGDTGAAGTNGTNGTDGITPTFKLENGELFVSYDEGENWTSLGNVKGDKGDKGDTGAA